MPRGAPPSHPGRPPGRPLGRTLAGPPLALPAPLDRLSDRWAAIPPRLRFAAIVTVALVVLVVAGHGAARSPWGPSVPVLVATTDLPAGHLVTDQDVTTVGWPARIVPESSLDAVDVVLDRTLASALPAGSPITAEHLTDGGLAGLLPPEHVAVAIPSPENARPQPGQRLDLLTGDGMRGGMRLASSAPVLRVDGDAIWVGVHRDDAPALAGALSWGEVTVALLPPGGPSVER